MRAPARVMIGVALALASGASAAVAGDEPPDAARPAHAIGPIVLEGSGEVPPQFVDKLRGEAQAALDAAEVRTVPRDAVAAILRTIPELATCGTRECAARLALALSAGRILTTRIAVAGELFDITVELVDDQGRPLRRRATRCVACTLNDAIARTTAAIRDLAEAERNDEVPVTVRSTPADAGVTIDGTWVGATPWAGALVAGPHHVIVSGARTVVRDVFLEAGASVDLAIAVAGPRRFGWLAYGAAGVGVGAVVGGVALLSIDGDGNCAQGTCPRVYETSALGWSATALGVVALGAAGWMLWRDHRGGHATVVPTEGGAAAVVGGRF